MKSTLTSSSTSRRPMVPIRYRRSLEVRLGSSQRSTDGPRDSRQGAEGSGEADGGRVDGEALDVLRRFVPCVSRPLTPRYVRDPQGSTTGNTVTESSAPSTPSSTAELSPSRAPARVLLIDDDFAILDGVSDFLESEGFSVVPASNGLEALNRLRSGLRVDAIVLDVMMPMMDGWDFRAEQLADPSLRDTPVVVISASGFTRHTLQQQFKAYEVLLKPIELGRFLRALRGACRARNDG